MLKSDINQLAMLAIQGDAKSQRALVEAVTDQVFRYLRALRLDIDLSEDAIQSAWGAFFARPLAYDRTRDFLPWFKRVARNMAVNDIRSRHPGREVQADLELIHGVGQSSLSPELENEEWRERVVDCWCKLSDEHRQRLTQRFPEGPRFLLDLLHRHVTADDIIATLQAAQPFRSLADAARKSDPTVTESAMRARVGRGLAALAQCLGLHSSG